MNLIRESVSPSITLGDMHLGSKSHERLCIRATKMTSIMTKLHWLHSTDTIVRNAFRRSVLSNKAGNGQSVISVNIVWWSWTSGYVKASVFTSQLLLKIVWLRQGYTTSARFNVFPCLRHFRSAAQVTREPLSITFDSNICRPYIPSTG